MIYFQANATICNFKDTVVCAIVKQCKYGSYYFLEMDNI